MKDTVWYLNVFKELGVTADARDGDGEVRACVRGQIALTNHQWHLF